MRKRSVGLILAGAMGTVLALEGGFLRRSSRTAIHADEAACRISTRADVCATAFSVARRAHVAHAPRDWSKSSCERSALNCEEDGARFRPVMAAIGLERRDRKLIARALYRPAAGDDWRTSGVGEAQDPESSSGRSGGASSSGSRLWGSNSADSSGTRAGGGERVSASGEYGAARGGFGARGRSFSFRGG